MGKHIYCKKTNFELIFLITVITNTKITLFDSQVCGWEVYRGINIFIFLKRREKEMLFSSQKWFVKPTLILLQEFRLALMSLAGCTQ